MATLCEDNVEAEFQTSMWDFQTSMRAALGQHEIMFDTIKEELSNLFASYENLRKNHNQGKTSGENSANRPYFAEK
jgi:hypothetical protein